MAFFRYMPWGLFRLLRDIYQLELRIMSAQDDIDAATAELTTLTTDIAAQVAQLDTDLQAIQVEISNLQAMGVNTNALKAAVAAAAATAATLDPAVAQITNLAPPAATPPPAPPPADASASPVNTDGAP